MATDLENLKAARSNYIQQLADLSDPAKRKPNYTIGGRTVDWVGYQTYLREQVKELNALIGAEDNTITVTSIG